MSTAIEYELKEYYFNVDNEIPILLSEKPARRIEGKQVYRWRDNLIYVGAYTLDEALETLNSYLIERENNYWALTAYYDKGKKYMYYGEVYSVLKPTVDNDPDVKSDSILYKVNTEESIISVTGYTSYRGCQAGTREGFNGFVANKLQSLIKQKS